MCGTNRISSSDLRILILPLPPLLYPWSTLSTEFTPLILPHLTPETLILFSQSDLLPSTLSPQEINALVADKMADVSGAVKVPEGVRWWIGSLKTGEGMERFVEDGIGRSVKERFAIGDSAESPLITNERHRHHLVASLAHLQHFLGQSSRSIDLLSFPSRALV